MKTLIRLFLVAVLTSSGLIAFAQGFRDSRGADFRSGPMNRPASNGRRLEAAKENFIGSQLQLTPDEALRFWPVYRQYQQELMQTRRLKRLNNSSAQADGTDQINKELYYDQKLVEIRKRYNTAFLQILPAQKVSMIYKTEREFNDELIRQMGERGN